MDNFDFMTKGNKNATSGDPKEQSATSGDPKVHQGLTLAQVKIAQSRAESKTGLDMDAFLKEVGVPTLNFEELLKFKPEG